MTFWLISFELGAEEEPEESLLEQILVPATQILLFRRDRKKRNGILNIPQKARNTSWWVWRTQCLMHAFVFSSFLQVWKQHACIGRDLSYAAMGISAWLQCLVLLCIFLQQPGNNWGLMELISKIFISECERRQTQAKIIKKQILNQKGLYCVFLDLCLYGIKALSQICLEVCKSGRPGKADSICGCMQDDSDISSPSVLS